MMADVFVQKEERCLFLSPTVAQSVSMSTGRSNKNGDRSLMSWRSL